MLTYKEILGNKRKEVGALIEKYRNGIVKLDEANETVKLMAAKSEKNNEEIAIQKAAAEIKEAEINSKKKTIDAALDQIVARTKVVEAEKIEAQNLAEAAEKELARAMPALEAANDAVDKLESKYIAEMKSMNVPHPDTHMVMMAVMTFLG
jgi:dynein heavy chain